MNWPHLQAFVAAACKLQLRVWLFGSALASDRPRDLDVLVVYTDRDLVTSLRAQRWWADMFPPLDIIAMTESEERHYRFIQQCAAIELT